MGIRPFDFRRIGLFLFLLLGIANWYGHGRANAKHHDSRELHCDGWR